MNRFDFRCFHCEQKLAIPEHGICSRCTKLLPKHPYCQQCGAPLLSFQPHCGNCLKDEPKWQRSLHISDYKAPLANWIHRFKFQNHYWLDKPLARLLFLEILTQRRERYFELPEVIFPVPLFWQRQWQRGYNQAELLAKYLAKWLNVPLDTQSLQRLRKTQSQRELTATERRRNLRGAFRYQPLKPYQKVAIVDDVITTGSTLNAICAELKKQGVKDIQVWALAKT